VICELVQFIRNLVEEVRPALEGDERGMVLAAADTAEWFAKQPRGELRRLDTNLGLVLDEALMAADEVLRPLGKRLKMHTEAKGHETVLLVAGLAADDTEVVATPCQDAAARRAAHYTGRDGRKEASDTEGGRGVPAAREHAAAKKVPATFAAPAGTGGAACESKPRGIPLPTRGGGR